MPVPDEWETVSPHRRDIKQKRFATAFRTGYTRRRDKMPLLPVAGRFFSLWQRSRDRLDKLSNKIHMRFSASDSGT